MAALAGFSDEAVSTVEQRRADGRPVKSIYELANSLTPAARNQLEAHYPELLPRLTFQSSSLVLAVDGWIDSYDPSPRQRIELLVTLLPNRLAVVWRRFA
jgi:hypothetical protein